MRYDETKWIMEYQDPSSIQTPHERKRHADDSLDNEQRLAKRFNSLNLDQISKLYKPASQSPSIRRSRSNAISDSMQLDDSRDRIYVHSLDDEISDSESEEGKLVFLPDIEKRLTKIPKSVLTSQKPPHQNNEVVLYSVPESLSIPREQDNVRKAILEARERAREKQAQDSNVLEDAEVIAIDTDGGEHRIPDEQEESVFVDEAIYEDDEDAMDIG